MRILTLSDSIMPRHRQSMRGPHKSQSLDERVCEERRATRVRQRRRKRDVDVRMAWRVYDYTSEGLTDRKTWLCRRRGQRTWTSLEYIERRSRAYCNGYMLMFQTPGT